MKITLVTPTGDRPEAFALCEKFVKRQTRKHDEWIVLDDGKKRTQCTQGQRYFYMPTYAGYGSLSNKMAFLANKVAVEPGVIFVIEDDDWYHPEYIAQMMRYVEQGFKLVGEGCAIYYNVKHRYWLNNQNMGHASLCSTAFHTDLLETVDMACQDLNPFLDMRLWMQEGFSKAVIHPESDGLRRCTVGIKSMPGRDGYGVGHCAHTRGVPVNYDEDMTKLVELVGPEDAKEYAKYFNP